MVVFKPEREREEMDRVLEGIVLVLSAHWGIDPHCVLAYGGEFKHWHWQLFNPRDLKRDPNCKPSYRIYMDGKITC